MQYKIPLFDLNYGKEETMAVLKVLQSKWISMGPNVNRLEEEFTKYLGIEHAIAVTNCTAALHLALEILAIKEGDEVIVPSLTFVATVNAVRYVRATPVFADIIGNTDLSIDPDDIARKITPRTKAIIVMHYGGFACDMAKIMRIAKKHNLFVIEDAAHAPGASYKEKKLGTIGQIGCFSFFSNKNITCSEGGMITTADEKIAEKAKLLRSHGMTSLSYARAKGHATEYDVISLGYNYRMDDIRGALALTQFRKLKKDLEKRAKLRDIYMNELEGIEDVIIPYKNHSEISSNYIFPIVLKDSTKEKRGKVRQKLAEAGIQTSVHYPAVHRFSIYHNYSQSLPKTEYVADNGITLPFFFKLSAKNIHHVASSLKQAVK